MIHAVLALAVAIVTGPQQAAAPPRLVVVLSVDQMRADYLPRFAEQFGGGLARLVQEGTRFTNAHQDHAITHTAPGHATISTGRFPARNGIVSNDWWDRIAGRRRYAVEDADSPIVGDATAPGRSPSSLLQTAVGDWLKQSSPQSKVWSVAIKDRSAIVMGGKQPDGVYWYSYDTGRFVTSAYYRADYPTWVQVFNDSGPVNTYLAGGWVKALPEPAYYLSREDRFAAEADGIETTFPHGVDGDTPDAAYYRRLPYSPFGDQLVFEFAQEMIANEGLGADPIPDLLFIGASAADFIGHSYGPYSHEVQDYYIRLDRMLADFTTVLDERVGAGNYVLVLTADHGVQVMPEELARRGHDARRVGTSGLQQILQATLSSAMRDLDISVTPVVQLVTGLVTHFPEGDVPPEALTSLRRRLADALTAEDFAADAFTYDELLSGEGNRPFLEMYRRSFHPDRAADVFFLNKQNHLLSSLPHGTSHGTPYRYDTHIPLVFWGPGFAAREYRARVRSVDIAPTLSALLGIDAPDDLDGRSLEWALGMGERH